MPENSRLMSKSICSTGLRWLWVVVAVLALDFGSKQWILANFTLGQSQPLIPSFNLFYARNYGAAFSFLADHGGWQRWFFAGIAIAIVAVLLVMMYRSAAQQKLNNIAYAFKAAVETADSDVEHILIATHWLRGDHPTRQRAA